jgi:NAD(P)-dependent dehydrogenase (short-subunit alcohol dehydrogenase family)
MNLTNKRVLITGVGIKPLAHVFRDKITEKSSHTSILYEGKEYKANLGAATALECAKAGAIVHIVCHSSEKATIVKNWISQEVKEAIIESSVVDLSKTSDLEQLVGDLRNDLPLYWVQSLGLGAGTVVIKDENPYLPIEQLTTELLDAELSVLTSTMTLLQLLLPKFKLQSESRICIVSSMSAIRGYQYGAMHAAAKGAISRFINSARMELDKYGIYITDIRPGMVDTGGYDSQAVRDANVKIGKTFGLDWSEKMFAMPPTAVGKAIVTALSSESNILSINMVAKGQELTEMS